MNYYLKNINTLDETTIVLQTRINGKPFKYSTGKKVYPKNWDNDKKKVLRGQPFYTATNDYLKNLQHQFHLNVVELSTNGPVCHKELRNKLDCHFGKVRKTNAIDTSNFETLWRDVWMKSFVGIRDPDTIKKKKYILKSLLDFQRETGFKLTLEAITAQFPVKFKQWALSTKKANGNPRYQRDNTIHKYINIVKEFSKWALKNGYTDNSKYQDISGYNEVYLDTFALEAQEIKKLMELNIDNIDLNQFDIRPCNHAKVKIALEKTRDSFIFRAGCGIRFIDYYQLHPSNIVGSTLSLVTEKTDTPIKVELLPEVLAILEKYNYKNLPKMLNQNENENLKLLGRIAGFNDERQVNYRLGGRTIQEIKQKWECLCTHTARKTFITSCVRAGIPQSHIMTITGITKESSFKRYVEFSDLDASNVASVLSQYYKK